MSEVSVDVFVWCAILHYEVFGLHLCYVLTQKKPHRFYRTAHIAITYYVHNGNICSIFTENSRQTETQAVILSYTAQSSRESRAVGLCINSADCRLSGNFCTIVRKICKPISYKTVRRALRGVDFICVGRVGIVYGLCIFSNVPVLTCTFYSFLPKKWLAFLHNTINFNIIPINFVKNMCNYNIITFYVAKKKVRRISQSADFFRLKCTAWVILPISKPQSYLSS